MDLNYKMVFCFHCDPVQNKTYFISILFLTVAVLLINSFVEGLRDYFYFCFGMCCVCHNNYNTYRWVIESKPTVRTAMLNPFYKASLLWFNMIGYDFFIFYKKINTTLLRGEIVHIFSVIFCSLFVAFQVQTCNFTKNIELEILHQTRSTENNFL